MPCSADVVAQTVSPLGQNSEEEMIILPVVGGVVKCIIAIPSLQILKFNARMPQDQRGGCGSGGSGPDPLDNGQMTF